MGFTCALFICIFWNHTFKRRRSQPRSSCQWCRASSTHVFSRNVSQPLVGFTQWWLLGLLTDVQLCCLVTYNCVDKIIFHHACSPVCLHLHLFLCQTYLHKVTFGAFNMWKFMQMFECTSDSQAWVVMATCLLNIIYIYIYKHNDENRCMSTKYLHIHHNCDSSYLFSTSFALLLVMKGVLCCGS